MDIPTTVSQVVSFLIPFVPYLQEAGKTLAKEITEDGWGKAKSIYQSIKSYVDKSSNETAQSVVTMFEKDPELYGDISSWAFSALPLHYNWRGICIS